MSEYKYIILEKEADGHKAFITLNRPEKLNAINDQMMDELIAALDEIEMDDSIWVVVIKGAGSCFSVGQDLSGAEDTKESSPLDPRPKPYLSDIWETGHRNMARFRRIYDFGRPIIAQVHGYCLGTGCDIALCCYGVVTSEDAVFGDPSVRLGMATRNPLWTWRVGLKKATELLLTGRYIDGKEAERIGLATIAVPLEKLEEETLKGASIQESGASMGGLDQTVSWRMCTHIGLEGCGMSTAWRFCANIAATSAIQRSGRSITDRGGFDFWGIREKQGLKAALEARDKPFEAYFPNPPAPRKP